MQGNKKGVVLIGMPGAGKSTVGRLLAELLEYPFVDTDDLMEARCGCSLQGILDEQGYEGFRRVEESVLLDVDCKGRVLATGGSAIYSDLAMRHLAGQADIVCLELELDQLQARVGSGEQRGLLRRRGQSLAEVYQERLPLYQRHAQFLINCSGLSASDVARQVKIQLQG